MDKTKNEIKNVIPDDRALILRGGGSPGNAWLIGVIAGLFDAGLHVTQAASAIGRAPAKQFIEFWR